jgi:hypothetical protein
MPERFVPLAEWLRPAPRVETPLIETQAPPPLLPLEEEDTLVDDVRAQLRRFRAVLSEALETDAVDATVAEQIVVRADSLLARFAR